MAEADVQLMNQSLSALKLEQSHGQDSPPCIHPVDITVFSPPAHYPRPPEGFSKEERYYALGWVVTKEWLKEFARRTCRQRLLQIDPNHVALGLSMLQTLTKYDHFHIFLTIPDHIPLQAYKGEIQPIIAISWTASRYLYFRRPTQMQYDWLKNLFGCEPGWYRDVLPKDCFRSHCIH